MVAAPAARDRSPWRRCGRLTLAATPRILLTSQSVTLLERPHEPPPFVHAALLCLVAAVLLLGACSKTGAAAGAGARRARPWSIAPATAGSSLRIRRRDPRPDRIAARLSRRRQDGRAAGRTSATRSRPARCWPSSTRTTCASAQDAARAAVASAAGQPASRPRPTSSATGPARPGLHQRAPSSSGARPRSRSRKAQLDQAQAQSSVQGNQAAYAALIADASGVITGVDVEPGMVVAAGAPVLRLAHDGPRDVVFSVPEDKVGLVQAVGRAPGAGSGAPVEQRRQRRCRRRSARSPRPPTR